MGALIANFTYFYAGGVVQYLPKIGKFIAPDGSDLFHGAQMQERRVVEAQEHGSPIYLPGTDSRLEHYRGEFWVLARHRGIELGSAPSPDSVRHVNITLLHRALPAVNTAVTCPSEKCLGKAPARVSGSVWSVTTHLNDIHRWTRDQIADWLESLDLDLTLTDGRRD